MRHLLVTGILGLATACASTTNGPSACTEIGCTNGLLVRVTPTSAWPHGDYRFILSVDDTEVTCTGALPLPPCGTPALSCDGEGVMIGESGCALDPSEHAFSDIMVASSPASVTLEVKHDDASVGSQSWTPRYQTVQPNGPECEPTCNNASVDLALAFE